MVYCWSKNALRVARPACISWRRRLCTLRRRWEMMICTETGRSVSRWWRWSQKLWRGDAEWLGFSRRVRSRHPLMIKPYEMQHGTSAGGRKKSGCGTDVPMYPDLVATSFSGYISAQGNGEVMMCKLIWKPFDLLMAMSCAFSVSTSSMIR